MINPNEIIFCQKLYWVYIRTPAYKHYINVPSLKILQWHEAKKCPCYMWTAERRVSPILVEPAVCVWYGIIGPKCS